MAAADTREYTALCTRSRDSRHWRLVVAYRTIACAQSQSGSTLSLAGAVKKVVRLFAISKLMNHQSQIKFRDALLPFCIFFASFAPPMFAKLNSHNTIWRAIKNTLRLCASARDCISISFLRAWRLCVMQLQSIIIDPNEIMASAMQLLFIDIDSVKSLLTLASDDGTRHETTDLTFSGFRFIPDFCSD